MSSCTLLTWLVPPGTFLLNNTVQQWSGEMRFLWLQSVSWWQWQQGLALTPYQFSIKALENRKLTPKASVLLAQHPQLLTERGKAVRHLCTKPCVRVLHRTPFFPSFSVNIVKHPLLGRNMKFTYEKENCYCRGGRVLYSLHAPWVHTKITLVFQQWKRSFAHHSQNGNGLGIALKTGWIAGRKASIKGEQVRAGMERRAGLRLISTVVDVPNPC